MRRSFTRSPARSRTKRGTDPAACPEGDAVCRMPDDSSPVSRTKTSSYELSRDPNARRTGLLHAFTWVLAPLLRRRDLRVLSFAYSLDKCAHTLVRRRTSTTIARPSGHAR